ncbi:ParM/StbA family protein [Turicibacter sanguinis]|uniref:ParM/StbA family protein n=1 Tax=Turicibacter sanguinis TaxID=154288 RepID=UPI0018A92747|nr:ParM/StbA family protein [Turicibacter sanguinis]MDB8567720.1 ParM/StbA family protein [Turicibacter sanguinis]MDB8570451.1 ParM/StbA family protein [Turicibacter sanguinis]MDB8573226.1 ParM/StbA family protein [Turicibacter sanguinis]MDB8581977.1 ParM/StbA family protein [Turicibacter sanguinis]
MNEVIKTIQYVGIDIGRGYVKGYSEHKGQKHQCMFKSLFSIGKNMDLSEYDNPIFLEIDKAKYFFGDLAEKEGHCKTNNFKDDKTSLTAELLLKAALSQLAVEGQVKVMLGVPYKTYRKSELEKIKSHYKGMKFTVTDKVTGDKKDITIVDISIFREADAALLWTVRGNNDFKNIPVALASVGFRTTELAYFDKGLKFNDAKSNTLELGNMTALEYIEDQLNQEGTKHTLSEIDSSNDYDEYKKIAYHVVSERIESEIERTWINLKEIAVFIAGGTALNLNINHELIEEPQMATSKGLWYVARKIFAK